MTGKDTFGKHSKHGGQTEHLTLSPNLTETITASAPPQAQTVKEMEFGFVNENSGIMASTWSSVAKTNSYLGMTVNMHNYNSLVIGDSNGRRSGSGFYLDRVPAHEFAHAVMSSNINYFHDLPNYILEGMAELTRGTDDDRRSEILYLAGNTTARQNALTTDCYDSYAGGFM